MRNVVLGVMLVAGCASHATSEASCMMVIESPEFG